jgi:hypothetical protein
MKMIKILQTVSFFSVLLIVVSCSTSRQYPRSYPPDYPVYHDPYPPQSLPPGQAKKVYGSRSARPYAPGQRKKYDRDYRYDNDHHRKHDKKGKKHDDDDDDD